MWPPGGIRGTAVLWPSLSRDPGLVGWCCPCPFSWAWYDSPWRDLGSREQVRPCNGVAAVCPTCGSAQVAGALRTSCLCLVLSVGYVGDLWVTFHLVYHLGHWAVLRFPAVASWYLGASRDVCGYHERGHSTGHSGASICFMRTRDTGWTGGSCCLGSQTQPPSTGLLRFLELSTREQASWDTGVSSVLHTWAECWCGPRSLSQLFREELRKRFCQRCARRGLT